MNTFQKINYSQPVLIQLFFLIFLAVSLNAQWIQTAGPYGWEFSHFAAGNGTVLAGSPSHGIYRSNDNGLNWTDVNNDLWATNITALGYDVENFLAGVYDGYGHMLFLSQDEGNSWSQINTVAPTGEITAFARIDSILIMAAHEDGVYHSSNGGINWTKAANSGLEHSIVDLVVIDKVILAGTMGGGVYRSADKGESWTMLPAPDYNFYVTSMSVINKVLYVAYAGTVYKSTNPGSEWTNISTGLPDSWSGNLYSSGTNLYFGSDQGIYLSTDGGGSWTNIGLSGAIVHAMMVSDSNLIAGTRDLGLFTSEDNGQNWVQTGALDNVMIQAMIALGPNFITGNNGQEGVFISRDNGNSFTGHTNLNHSYVLALEKRGTDIFAGTEVAGDGGGGVFKSADSGRTWEMIGLQNVIVVSFAFKDSYIFAGTVQGVYRTQTEGAVWNYVSNGLSGMRVEALATVDTIVYAATGYGVYQTTNNGGLWTVSGLPDTAVTSLLNVDNTLYAATYLGIYKLAGPGGKWLPAGLPDVGIYKLIANQSILFAGTSSGVFAASPDDGQWISINEGFDAHATTLAINDEYLFAGTWGEKVWRRSLADITTGVEKQPRNIAQHYSLMQNYPNPFNPVTTIDFILPNSGYAELLVFDMLGKEVANLVSGNITAGYHSCIFDAGSLASGVYYYQLMAGEFVEVRKMILIR